MERKVQEIEALAELGYSHQQIAQFMSLAQEDAERMRSDDQHPFFLAYRDGVVKTEIELRKSILKLAKAGSSPAQTLMIKILKDNEARNFWDEGHQE